MPRRRTVGPLHLDVCPLDGFGSEGKMLKKSYHGCSGKHVTEFLPAHARTGFPRKMDVVAVVWLFAVLLLVAGCNQNNASPAIKRDDIKQSSLVRNTSRPDMLVVGGETITYVDMVNTPLEQNLEQSELAVPLIDRIKPLAQAVGLDEFKKLARPVIEQQLRNQISTILLYQEARRQIDKDIDEPLERAADREYRRLLIRYGGDEAKAEESLKKAGMTREVFKEHKKKAFAIQYYIGSKLSENRPITYSEMTQAYDQMKAELFAKPAVVTFRLIDIDMQKFTPSDPNADRLAQARELANQLLKRIEAGEDFAELAGQYSSDHRREFGGLWMPKNPKSLAKPYDILVAEAEKIQPGQIAGPVEVPDHIFIMKLEEKTPESYEPLEAVQDRVKEKIVADRRERAFEELNTKVMEQAAIIPTDKFVDFCLEQVYQTSRR